MRRLLLFSFLILLSVVAQSQHRADKWYFGTLAGIDFTSGVPTVLDDGLLNDIEGAAGICDTAGNLLFYTDAKTVWNKLHQPMPNGTGLAGGFSSQGAVVVPLPGSPSVYFIFTNDAVAGPNGFCYSVVDMSLDSGRGDVITKNIFIRSNLTEKMTAVANATGDAYWISVHEFGTDTFYNYSLESFGLDTTPVICETGIRHSNLVPQNAYGQMKFSPCGDKLAVAIGYLDTVQIFDFDDATGILSNPLTVDMPDHVFGIEFSPNGQLVYVSTYSPVTLYQIDPGSGGTTTSLSIAPDTYGLQLGPDGKIYVAKNQSTWIGAITDPDIPGPSCHYVDTAINIDSTGLGHTCGLVLPGFVQSFFRTSTSCLGVSVVETERKEFSIYPNPTFDRFIIQNQMPALYEIFDINGRHLQTIDNKECKEKSFGNDLHPGLYIIRIKTDGKMITEKIIKY